MDKVYMCFLITSVIGSYLKANGTTVKRNSDVICEDLPEPILIDILGPAYNSRYMSVREPPMSLTTAENKRKRNMVPPFYVDQNYAEILADEPAWSVNHFQLNQETVRISMGHERRKRSPMDAKQWECKSEIVWKDLGPDYFPRYLRTVQCTAKVCWFGHFRCKPRSFTVKLLKRRRNRCTTASPNTKIGTNGLHEDLKQLWVWEEHAVNFCCDCSYMV